MKQEEKKIETLNDKIKDYLGWKKNMEQKGWKWDKTRNNFYRLEGQNKVWNKSGYLLDLRVDNSLQSSS